MSINFSEIFDIYSRRNQVEGEPRKELTESFKNRLWWLSLSAFPNTLNYGRITEESPFWSETYRKLQWLLGTDRLPGHNATSYKERMSGFLNQCSDEHFLDFTEFLFKTTSIHKSKIDVRKLVDDINVFFQVDNLPYYLTAPVFNSNVQNREVSNQLSNSSHLEEIEQYPQIIRRENFALHNTAIGPVLSFLTNPALSEANKEFLEALEDYREAQYSDCIVKCGSSLESVLKVICEHQKWPYRQNDTAGILLQNVIPKTNLDTSFQQQLLVVPTIRNRYGSAHGRGTETIETPAHIARYVLNATGSSILLLVEEVGL